MKKTRLQIEYDYDFFLLGIVTAVKEYKLAWYLNDALGVDLTKQEDIVIPKVDTNNLTISNLMFKTEHATIRLIGNRSVEESSDIKSNLLPELQNFTHFFVLQDESEAFDKIALMDQLKSIEIIDYVVAIEPEKLKNKDNLIF